MHAASADAAASRPRIAIRAPWLANRRAVARPMPRALAAQFAKTRTVLRCELALRSVPEAYLRSLISEIEVDDTKIRIKGSKDALEKAVSAGWNGVVPG